MILFSGAQNMKKLKVAIFCGGKSGEHEVSIASAAAIYNALDMEKYDVTLLGIDKSGRWLLPSQTKALVGSANPMLVKLKQ
jgi:D-alanine-D-alanine ligase